MRINQDPYAAEFQRPGRGRIEVVTKAGSDAYHGSLDATLRVQGPGDATVMQDDLANTYSLIESS